MLPQTTTRLLDDLAAKGGAIVSTASCCPCEIALAQDEGRFGVDRDGLGFVRREQEWLRNVTKPIVVDRFAGCETGS